MIPEIDNIEGEHSPFVPYHRRQNKKLGQTGKLPGKKALITVNDMKQQELWPVPLS
jgi:hypothetical protein